MNIFDKKDYCKANNLPWTADDEHRYNKEVLRSKRKLFCEFGIPFPNNIEIEFKEQIAKGNPNAEVYLDNLCHSYIKYALDNYPQIICEFVKVMHSGERVYEDVLRSELIAEFDGNVDVGNYATRELLRSGLLECCGSRNGMRKFSI